MAPDHYENALFHGVGPLPECLLTRGKTITGIPTHMGWKYYEKGWDHYENTFVHYLGALQESILIWVGLRREHLLV